MAHSKRFTFSPCCTFPRFGKAPSAWWKSKYWSASVDHQLLTRSRSRPGWNQIAPSLSAGRKTMKGRSVVEWKRPVK